METVSRAKMGLYIIKMQKRKTTYTRDYIAWAYHSVITYHQLLFPLARDDTKRCWGSGHRPALKGTANHTTTHTPNTRSDAAARVTTTQTMMMIKWCRIRCKAVPSRNYNGHHLISLQHDELTMWHQRHHQRLQQNYATLRRHKEICLKFTMCKYM